jgi:hypothetical protein
MAVNLSPIFGAGAQLFTNDGVPLAGGLIYTYSAGTSTPASVYTSSLGNIAHSNPIVLDSSGRVPSGEIWMTDNIAYKFVVKDATFVLIGTYDNLVGINSNFVSFTSQEEAQTVGQQGQSVFTLTTMQYQPATNNLLVFVNGSKQIVGENYSETSSTVITFADGLNIGDIIDFTTATPISGNATTSDNVSYNEGCPGAVTRTLTSKLQDTISFTDFGAVGDNLTNDTIAMQAAVDCVSAGAIIDGLGLTYLSYGLIINKEITIQNCTIHLANSLGPTTTESCFNVTANNVKLLNCGSLVVTAELGNITNAVGVFADGVNNLYIDSGKYTGSKSALGNYGVIHIINANQPKVTNVTVNDSFGDGIYFFTCNNPEALSNICDTNGGSGVTADSCIGALISYNYIVDSGQSGLACNSSNSIVSFNYVKNPATNGITSGELSTENVQIVSNVVEGALQTPGIASKYAGILIQQAQKTQVLNNIIREPQVGATSCDGISFVNLPISFECSGNIISSQTGGGITVIDTNNACGGNITNNTIESPDFSGIDILGCSRMIISGNIITNANRANDPDGMGIYIDNGITSPEFLTIINNVITDTTPYQRYAIYLASEMSSSTYCKINGNTVRGWITNAYVGIRSCIYDVANNDWDGTPKTGFVTLTNGGTTSTVTTDQYVLNSNVVLSIGNNTAYALNPKYWQSSSFNGAFDIQHTAGTAAGEQIKWVIL